MQDFEKKETTDGLARMKEVFSLHQSTCSCDEQVPTAKHSLPGAVAALTAVSALLVACKKDPEVLYELNEVPLQGSSADKTRQKSNQQYVNILHTNLFQSGLSSGQAFQLDQLFQSIGDKEVAKEVLISNYFNEAGVQMPTVEEMNADLNGFIEDTYKRFFIREPNEAEKTWIKNFIQSNPFMTPELVYFSFALSNEYQYY